MARRGWLAAEKGVLADIDILVGPFGKAWAAQGAFVAANAVICDYLINTARSLIYTTALPPIVLSWLLFVSERIARMEEERRHLAALASTLRKKLKKEGLRTGGTSHIIPVLVGDSERCVEIANHLRGLGYWLTAVRPPTVPQDSARLRLSLSAALQWDDLQGLPAAIAAAMKAL